MTRTGAVALLGAVLSAGCSRVSEKPVGPLREVTVLSEHWDRVEAVVTSILQQPVLTPQPEPEFRLRVGRFEEFRTYSRFRLLLIIGTSQDTVIRAMLGHRADSLPAGDCGLFRIPNPWADDQFALVFVAAAPERLVSGLTEYAGRIRYTLREIVLGQMNRAVYLEGVVVTETRRMGETYAFTLDVPKRWLLNEENADGRFVYVHGHFPDRSVFAYWEDSERVLVPESLVALRDRLTGEYYDGDSAEPAYIQADSIEFLAEPALRLSGIWQNEEQVIGGPFVTYALNFKGRFYLIDGMVYNPGQKKLNALAQVEAVARTFTPR
jgi:hypothetical protein